MRLSLPLVAVLLACACLASASRAAAEGWDGGGYVAPERPAEPAAPPPLGASLIQLDAEMETLGLVRQARLLAEAPESDAGARLIAAAAVSPALLDAHAARIEQAAGREGLEALRRRAEALSHHSSVRSFLSARVRALTDDASGGALTRLFDGLDARSASPVVRPAVDMDRALPRLGDHLAGLGPRAGFRRLEELVDVDAAARLIAAAVAYPELLSDEARRKSIDAVFGREVSARLHYQVDRLTRENAGLRSWESHKARGWLRLNWPLDAREIVAGLPSSALREPLDADLAATVLDEPELDAAAARAGLGRLVRALKRNAAARLIAAAAVDRSALMKYHFPIQALLGAAGDHSVFSQGAALAAHCASDPLLAELNRGLDRVAPGWREKGLPALLDGLPVRGLAEASAATGLGSVDEAQRARLAAPPITAPEPLRRDVERMDVFIAADPKYAAKTLAKLSSVSRAARLVALAVAYPGALRDPSTRARLDELGGRGTPEVLAAQADRLHLPPDVDELAAVKQELHAAFGSGALDASRLFAALPSWAFQEPADPALAEALLRLEPAQTTLARRRRLLELGRAARTDRVARLLIAGVADHGEALQGRDAELDAYIGPIAREALRRRASELDDSGMLESELLLMNARRKAKKALRGATTKEWRSVSLRTLLSGTAGPRLSAPAEPRPAALPAPEAPPMEQRAILAPMRARPLDGASGRRVRALASRGGEAFLEGAQELSARREGELRVRVVAHPDDPAVAVKIYHDPASLQTRERLEEKLERLAPLSEAGVAPRLLERGDAALPGAGLAHYYAQERVEGRKLSQLSSDEWPAQALDELRGRLKAAGLALEVSTREELLARVVIAKDAGGRERAYVLDGKASPASGEALDANQALLAAALERKQAPPPQESYLPKTGSSGRGVIAW